MTAATQAASSDAERAAMSARKRLQLEGPIVPTLLQLAWPNLLVLLVQASTGFIEFWYIRQ